MNVSHVLFHKEQVQLNFSFRRKTTINTKSFMNRITKEKKINKVDETHKITSMIENKVPRKHR